MSELSELKKAVVEQRKTMDKVYRHASLRDHFAGLAMQALIAQGDYGTWDITARNAYSYADAMLKEREGK